MGLGVPKMVNGSYKISPTGFAGTCDEVREQSESKVYTHEECLWALPNMT